jgi:hypothetical protein
MRADQAGATSAISTRFGDVGGFGSTWDRENLQMTAEDRFNAIRALRSPLSVRVRMWVVGSCCKMTFGGW